MAKPTLVPQASGPVWYQKLRRWQRLLIIGAVSLLVLSAVGLMSFAGALIALVGLALGVAFIPAGGERERQSSAASDQNVTGLLPGARRLAESLPDPCFVLAADGTVIYANDRALATFGIKPGELLPYRLRYPELVAAFGRVTGGAGPQQVQFVERVPTERYFAAWLSALDQVADRDSYLLIIDDLTEARASERMRADFVANASHELRTPLASLSGFIETLQGPAKDDRDARDRFLAMMHDQAMRMKRLIDDLLSLSRVEMRAHLRPGDRLDLVPLIRHVIDTLAPLAKDNGVRIETELPAGKIMIPGDRDELVQVFSNLIENACKYGHSGKRVIVGIRVPEGAKGCSVAVTDFGPGIAPEHLPRLTERFYRVDAEESRRHRGTGLGLAIVKHIISRHRARLQIESQPGHGAQFIVHFPECTIIAPEPIDKTTTDQPVVVS